MAAVRTDGTVEIPSGVSKALFMLGRGFCYRPGCRRRVIVMVEGEPKANVEIAHIRAVEVGGVRWDVMMTRRECRSFGNLILLCEPHLKQVTAPSAAADFPVEVLESWKAERERNLETPAGRLGTLDEDQVLDLMEGTVKGFRHSVEDALARMSVSDSEDADYLRSLILAAFDRPYQGTDLDAVESLERSADLLRRLPDAAETLGLYAHAFRTLPDAAEDLASATGRLGRIEYYIEKLQRAETSLGETADRMVLQHLPAASDSVRALQATPEWLPSLERVAEQMTSTVGRLNDFNPTTVVVPDRQRWNYFKAGALSGAVVAAGIAVLVAAFGSHLIP